MDLSSVVQLDIDISTVTIAQASFSTLLIATCHSVFPERMRLYSSLKEIEADGFPTYSPTYLAAQAAFSQSPRPAKIAIGRRANAFTQTIELVPVITSAGFKYEFEIVSALGVVTSISYEVLNGATVNSICVALAALIDAVDNAAAVVSPAAPNATKIVVTSTSGNLVNFRKLPKTSVLTIKDVTTDPGIAADLSAIEAENARDWYALTLDHSSQAVIEEVAAWIESRNRLAVLNTSDSACLDGVSTTDIAAVLKAASRARTELLFSGNALQSYSAAAWLGKMLPKPPGSATWAYKTLKGILPDAFSTSQETAAKNKRLNTYVSLGGANVTLWGQTPDAGWTDIIIGRDWLFAGIQEANYRLLISNDKIPYTNGGKESFRNATLGVLDRATRAPYGFLASDPEPTCSFPNVEDVDEADRANRHLPGGEFTGTLTGAIHTLAISGTLTQ